jgi:hypothetical protein
MLGESVSSGGVGRETGEGSDARYCLSGSEGEGARSVRGGVGGRTRGALAIRLEAMSTEKRKRRKDVVGQGIKPRQGCKISSKWGGRIRQFM